jgi:thiol-disulfide isomerase/thioredoxin
VRRALLVVAVLGAMLPAAAFASGIFVPGGKRPAPVLAGTDAIGGKHVSLARWAGKPLLVNLWGSWCHPCRDEAGQLRRFLARHPHSVLGIDVEDSKQGARGFQQRYAVHFPSIFDPQDLLVHRLKATGTPTTYFLDSRHRIVAALYGAGTLALFERGWKLAAG